MKRSKQIKVANQEDAFTEQDRRTMIEARKTAMRIAFEEGSVSADILREKFPGVKTLHRNAIGSIFKTEDFIWNGVKKSKTPERKSGLIGVYRLADEAIAFVSGQYERKKIA